MKERELVHGFRIERIRGIADLSGTLYELRHEKTGARLAWMKNTDENKLFSVAFKTLPFDDTGVFHILEHSVLGGSEKYPVKEPFLEMLKSSMNTFLNALTFPDMTVFPVSSRNDTDFMNLVSVYLDAVFHPLIYKEPRIFRQEGWHIELRDENGEPDYKGVVFNEMKGALSSVNDRITTEMCRMLFPDNCYRFESGGDPAFIPDLTLERFVDTHRKFYSPSNAYFFIDGPVDIEKLLAFIDEEYLSADVIRDAPGEIPLQKPIKAASKRLEYDLSSDQELEGNTYIALGKVVGTYEDIELIYAISALSEALAGSNEAPLKRALLDTGHCLDVSMGIIDGILQPFALLEIMNTDEEYSDELIGLVKEKTAEIVSTGIDKEALSAAIDRMEFRYREGSEPKGLDHALNALCSWIHGGDPILYLDCASVFERLRAGLKTDYYEKTLGKWLLEEDGSARLIMIPSHEYAAEQEEKERARLNDTLSSMDESQISALVNENAGLDDWQRSSDSPEALKTLPALPLCEVSPEPLRYDTEVEELSGVKILRHPSKERGISSLNLYFDVNDLSPDEVFLLKIASGMIGELPTRNNAPLLLRQKINSVFGDLYFTVDAYAREGALDSCNVFFISRGSFLDAKKEEAFDLIAEILNETLFIPELIREQLVQLRENYKQSIISRGSSYAVRRTAASSSTLTSFIELTSGYESYSRLCNLIKTFDDDPAAICDTLRRLVEMAVCKSRMTVSTTAFDRFSVADLTNGFESGSPSDGREFAWKLDIPKLSGIIIPAQISFTGQSFISPVEDIQPWRVLSNILSLDYLWNEIRVKGGAYGAGASVNSLGIVSFNSFRDPDASGSFDVYSKAYSSVRDFLATVGPLDKFIIGTIARQEPLISDAARGIGADELYFRGVDYEMRKENRRRILSTSMRDLIAAAEHLSGDFRRCVVGSETVIRSFEKDGFSVNSL